jgi:hypothetical protein
VLKLDARELWRRIAAMEMEIYQPQDYPKPVQAKINALGSPGITIANRWMRGWSKVVKDLKTGEYLGYLKTREREERRILSEPGTITWRITSEKAELYGLSLKPPMAGP